jgi:hypothetical protein
VVKSVDYRDLIGGILLIIAGGFAAIYAQRYALGTMRNMGPGFFPTMLGIGLTLMGAIIATSSLRRSGTLPTLKLRELGLVLLGIVCFALLLRGAGLVVATLVTVVVCSLADRETQWRARVLIAASIAALTVLIFRYGLGVNVPLWWW